MYMWSRDAHATVSSGRHAYEASVQVCQRDVVYDNPSSRLTAFGRLKPNNKCKLQSEEQIRAGEDNCSIMVMCVWMDACILYNRDRERERGREGHGVTKCRVLTSQTDCVTGGQVGCYKY